MPFEDVVQRRVVPRIRLESLLSQVVHEHRATAAACARVYEGAVEVEGDRVDASRG